MIIEFKWSFKLFSIIVIILALSSFSFEIRFIHSHLRPCRVTFLTQHSIHFCLLFLFIFVSICLVLRLLFQLVYRLRYQSDWRQKICYVLKTKTEIAFWLLLFLFAISSSWCRLSPGSLSPLIWYKHIFHFYRILLLFEHNTILLMLQQQQQPQLFIPFC